MDKKYEIPDTEPQMASEPVVAYASMKYTNEGISRMSNISFDSDDAPCQFSVDEVKTILLKNHENYQNGHYHTMAEVNSIMDSWG